MLSFTIQHKFNTNIRDSISQFPETLQNKGIGSHHWMTSGENGIRTREASFETYRISNPALSATQPSLPISADADNTSVPAAFQVRGW